MPFPSNGENHVNGIKNEKNIVDYLNRDPTNTINHSLEQIYGSKIVEWKHQGGTQQKRDASVKFESGESIGISIKNHKQGTFDWHNTTKGVDDTIKSSVKQFKLNNLGTDIPKKGGVRSELDNMLNSFLDGFTSKDISAIFNNIYMIEEHTRHIIVNDVKNKKLIFLDESNLDPYFNKMWKHGFFIKSTPRAKTSRQIWLKSADGYEINTNLRIRLHLNNGIKALLGQSKKNKNSVPCLKIQQDNVGVFISKCFGKVIAEY